MKDDEERLGVEKLSDKKQSRIPDDALEELGAEADDFLEFKTYDEEDTILVRRLDI